MNHYEALLDKLEYIRTLEDDWDDCGAVKPYPDSIDASVEFLVWLNSFGKLPETIVAVQNGNVSFEFRSIPEYTLIDIEVCAIKREAK